jgi:hypothetical protein
VNVQVDPDQDQRPDDRCEQGRPQPLRVWRCDQ